MHILLTRPIEDSKELIIKLNNLGHKVSHLPVINVVGEEYRDFSEEELLENVCNLVFISKRGKLKASEIGRIKDITELPSPYKAGILDEYLDGRLLPTIQTNRGCPFTCTFCTEGQSIWSRITKKKVEVVNAEIDYIYAKMMELEPDKRRYDLLITDSNFGMYPEDIEISKHISKLQKKSGWPKYINVATGKNNKERVLEAAKILNGALSLAGSVQSLDKNILEKIQRKLDIFIANKIETLMPNLLSLANSNEFSGAAAGFAHIFVNNLGVIMKSQVIDQFKSIDNESKVSLRKAGIKFGYKTIYDATLLKPEASKLRIALFNAFYATIESKTFQPPPGLVTVEFDKHISKKQYLVAGFFVAGNRAVRIDMLERLYFLIKECTKDEWIVVQPAMLSITGLGLENFAELIKNLRYEIKYEKVEKGDEVITLEKDSDYYRVMFKKQLLNKKAKQIEISDAIKKKRHQYKKKKPNNRIAKNDSPFSSLRVLLKN